MLSPVVVCYGQRLNKLETPTRVGRFINGWAKSTAYRRVESGEWPMVGTLVNVPMLLAELGWPFEIREPSDEL